MVAKKNTSKRGGGPKLEPGDSPINIGGGGGIVIKGRKGRPFADIDFKDSDYPGDHGVFETDTLQLNYVLVNGARLPNVGRNTPLLIFYERGVGPGTIAINQSANRMSVRFNELHFQGNRGHHHGENLEILQLKAGARPPQDIPPESKIEVHTEFRPDSSKRIKRR